MVYNIGGWIGFALFLVCVWGGWGGGGGGTGSGVMPDFYI